MKTGLYQFKCNNHYSANQWAEHGSDYVKCNICGRTLREEDAVLKPPLKTMSMEEQPFQWFFSMFSALIFWFKSFKLFNS